MKKIFLVHFVLFSFLLNAYSQSDYRPGYVILNTSDTLYGYIDFRTDFSNSQHCYFKKDNNSNYIEYLPDQLIGYRFIDGKYYVSKNIRISNIERKVFLEILIFGKVKIYYSVLEDEPNNLHLSKPHSVHYYIEKDTSFYEINNDVITKELPNGEKTMKNTNQYKGMLNVFFSDCPDISKKINNTSFSKESLINIAKDYHERVCTNEQCIIFEKPVSKRKYIFGMAYCYSIPPTLNYYGKTNFSFSSKADRQLSIGAFTSTNIDNDYRYWVQLRVMYQSQSYSSSGLYQDAYPSEYMYKFSSVLADFTLKYRFKLTGIKPYVYGGFLFGSILSDQYKMISTYNFHTEAADSNDQKIMGGFTVGTGFEYTFIPHLSLFLSVSYDYYQTFTILQLKGLSINTGFFF